MPDRIGRYAVLSVLGRGEFGVVYLANDPQLQRHVALKVPRKDRFTNSDHVANFLQEARSAAKLNHPGLVAVYDVQEEQGSPFIVQEFIDGENLRAWVERNKPDVRRIVEVLIELAEALDYAHRKGLTHCDLKMDNVLMDHGGKPHLADFGLALPHQKRGDRNGARFGTPCAMAPEQVRGEGHRLDGRTDVWALGVMFYELLTGQRPFQAQALGDLFNEIEAVDPKPVRQIDHRLPSDLERICERCLQKRRSDRYSSMRELLDDLRDWQSRTSEHCDDQGLYKRVREDRSNSSTFSGARDSQPMVVPKGLRSFEAEDASFFLSLLPGPRDRDGLPRSIRFWKNRIEEMDGDKTFAVGLVYGPSGCGKSSLVKAGLLPTLSESILPVYVEASAEDMEDRILKKLQRVSPQFDSRQPLPATFAKLRESGIAPGRKLLIVVDQFEQWLHAHSEMKLSQLVDAFRQCDGAKIQILLLVRDDFFASVHRLFQELELALVDGVNYAWWTPSTSDMLEKSSSHLVKLTID